MPTLDEDWCATPSPLPNGVKLPGGAIWHERACDIAEKILADKPKIVGIGVYIWNAKESLELVRILKSVRPELVVVLGGPEVSYEVDEQEIIQLADYLVIGEGDLAFAALAQQILVEGAGPSERLIEGGTPDLKLLQSPYSYYSDADIENRSIYVEASRGCPFRCEFCLSALDSRVRTFPIESILHHLHDMMDRGARQFKFVDRTFKLSMNRCVKQ